MSKSGHGQGKGSGAAIMRSVSLFLASGRRASAPRKRAEAGHATVPAYGSKRQHHLMTTARTNKLPQRLLDSFNRRTHFNKHELEALHQMYRRLSAGRPPPRRTALTAAAASSTSSDSNSLAEGIDRTTFRTVLHGALDLVAEEPLAERMWAAWAGTGAGTLKLEPWIMGLNTALRGTTNEKVAYCFRVYDLNSDGFITKDEMFVLLRNSLIKQPGDEDPEEGARELSELALRQLDADRDGRVSVQDYRQAVARDPLLLEALGRCLPSKPAVDTFLETLQH